MLQLLEVIYEGGPILDLCLHAQRKVLAAELPNRFSSIDLRRTTQAERKKALQDLVSRGVSPASLLVRGLSGLSEVTQAFPRASLFLDALGRSETPTRRSLSLYAYKTKRVFVYSQEMGDLVRDGGIGAITLLYGPFFPRLSLDEPEGLKVGVLDLGFGIMPVLGSLKKLRKEQNLSFEIVTTMPMADTVKVESALEVAAESTYLVSPQEQMDRNGPDEGAILAVCAGRALCTAPTNALYAMPYALDKYMPASRYAPGSYANSVLLYQKNRAVYDSWPKQIRADVDAVPKEVLRRLQ